MSRAKLLPMYFSARAWSRPPRLMAASGAPPRANSAVRPEIIDVMGEHRPMPAMASAPSSMRPTYILSAMLYASVIICAHMAGSASDQSSRGIFSVSSLLRPSISIPPESAVFHYAVIIAAYCADIKYIYNIYFNTRKV